MFVTVSGVVPPLSLSLKFCSAKVVVNISCHSNDIFEGKAVKDFPEFA